MDKSYEVPTPIALNEQRGQTFPALVRLMQILLSPEGCPWDREQTPESLRRYVLEEACEVIDAIDSGSGPHLQEELGDLALQIAFLSELAREQHGFGPDDAIRSICEKLVRRHPHVFAQEQVSNSGDVVKNWEAIKAQEKPRTLLTGIPKSLSALLRAQQQSARAAKVGFDWPNAQGSREKVSEELNELDAAVAQGDSAQIKAELGDLLFALVNLARHHGIDAEAALRGTCDKFEHRFNYVEAGVVAKHGGWPQGETGKPTAGLPLEELDGYWNEAKAKE
ncbi:MAG TPA: nucleoside triphosphate pyrophosphohydrolase [Polyangiaceae bacterium]|nr:nucleoside triphosphate pyrophosphohydrolase [Polyangiaceae bacterium]